jgi:hypothetical protein
MPKEDNLTPFKPGVSGNPKGYPKGKKNRSTIIKELLATAHASGTSNEYAMNQAMLEKALDGDLPSIKEIQDSVYGKIPDKNLNAEVPVEDLERDVTDAAIKHLPDDVIDDLLKEEKAQPEVTKEE